MAAGSLSKLEIDDQQALYLTIHRNGDFLEIDAFDGKECWNLRGKLSSANLAEMARKVLVHVHVWGRTMQARGGQVN